jgi:hypothetical protein
VLVVGVVGGAFVTVADPVLPGQVAHSVTADVEWLTGSLSRIGDATRHSPQAPVPEPTGTRPDPLITAAPTPDVTTYPSIPLTDSSPRTSLSTPTPAPTRAPSLGWTLPWSGNDRDWALTTLTLDEQLDTQAETTYPQYQQYYAGWAMHWARAIALIQGLEYPQAEAPSASTLNPIVSWFNLAISLHQSDEQTYPQNSAWDNTWIANYQRLDALWAKL